MSAKKSEKKAKNENTKDAKTGKKDKPKAEVQTPASEEQGAQNAEESAGTEQETDSAQTEGGEQATLPGVEKPKEEKPKEEKKPKKERTFNLKDAIEQCLIDGKTPQAIVDELTPLVQQHTQRDVKWSNNRVKQEMGFFRNYSGHVSYKLDLVNALVSELAGMFDFQDRALEIVNEVMELTAPDTEPAAAEGEGAAQ